MSGLKQRFFAGISALFIGVSLAMPVAAGAKVIPPTLRNDAPSFDHADTAFVSAIVIDVKSGKRLYEYKPDLRWSAASLTKLMTSMVVVDTKPNWNRIVSLTKKDNPGGGILTLGKVSARVRMKDLLYSSIVASTNNTTIAMARATGLTTKQFVRRMNLKGKVLGLTNTTFVEPSGIDDNNMTTAADIAKIANAAFNVPAIQRAATTPIYHFSFLNTGTKKTVKSTDNLLTKDDEFEIIGAKTGFLYNSRYNFVTRVKPVRGSSKGPELLIVVMGAPTWTSQFQTTKSLAKWAWNAYSWPSAKK